MNDLTETQCENALELASTLLFKKGYRWGDKELIALLGRGNEDTNLDATGIWVAGKDYCPQTDPEVQLQQAERDFDNLLRRFTSLTKARQLKPLKPNPWQPQRALTHREIQHLAATIHFILRRIVPKEPLKAPIQQTTGYHTASTEAAIARWIRAQQLQYSHFPSELTPLLANRLWKRVQGFRVESG